MEDIRTQIQAQTYIDEAEALKALIDAADFTPALRQEIHLRGAGLVRDIRKNSNPSMMELFLAEYGLSSEEGVALMCLAEALLRVPDAPTMDALIEDKIAPSAWGAHISQSHSSLVNASTWALFMTGKVLSDEKANSVTGVLHGAIKRLGEPVIRRAVTAAMKEMGRQFVLGETISKAMKRASEEEDRGFTYSYDMLGEAAKTEGDAKKYHMAYADAIAQIAKSAKASSVQENPGISIKLSALFPRYEEMKRIDVMQVLMPRARSLAILAKSAGIGLNIDAEEAARLDLSLDVIEAVLRDPALAGWDGFGVVVQAYSKRASGVLDYLYAMAQKYDRKIMVRLVKGAYWDSEIKLAQVEGLAGFPVFTRKAATDVSYLCCAQKLLGMVDRIYPQFATHNAHSVAAILEMAPSTDVFEFQRLHGMGEALHEAVHSDAGTRCRIYAPVGAHKDLLAYLVRRLLENGANSSFVNQIVDEDVPPEEVAADPFQAVLTQEVAHNPLIQHPNDLFAPERINSRGWDLNDRLVLDQIKGDIESATPQHWQAKTVEGTAQSVTNPATGAVIGEIGFASSAQAMEICASVGPWAKSTLQERQAVLNKAADLYEAHATRLFALLIQEAGKTLLDCVGELREAVDFLRFYAAQATDTQKPLGVFACISPWNFPLAIFTGQISAALAVGNGVVAKPAESTSLIADYAVDLLYQAGVPRDVLRLIAGEGAVVGTALSGHKNIAGICFTGSTATAQVINRQMAQNLPAGTPLVAETGGLNAMIVDSTALPEQAIGDVIASAFQSAGQRCSALRVLYLQEDIADNFLEMLYGAMDALSVGNPADFSTDIGPIIDVDAAANIQAHVDRAKAEGRLLRQISAPEGGRFVAPAVIKLNSISELESEIFGPVLHVVTFGAEDIDQVIADVNATGFGLTFGLQTRIDDRVQHVIDRVHAGNIYVNRNQIGAIVGSQPFGGHGLSGTGPKAGGIRYLSRFCTGTAQFSTEPCDLPGPTGESNRYAQVAKSHVLCMGPGDADYQAQVQMARAIGVGDCMDGREVSPDDLRELSGIEAVVYWGDDPAPLRRALAAREGAIVPLILGQEMHEYLYDEVTICIDTTASGGNAALIGGEA
ncbi:bifunctional protein PutA [Amylibacter marinus]|uniref:Bifunctional protein PutA n=1 Tax=Amylibacter marinus TaxID=1475483 RepID=A0ABQ5VSR3_9RHOB|nr:bifunctional proline dehydrogenase/L-glutamate gamma-semialdehyde dehydrogenase PutA [Amylibacter marinus]GLQ34229.1 bifunctional protein PutA [Amylibacter marinus]